MEGILKALGDLAASPMGGLLGVVTVLLVLIVILVIYGYQRKVDRDDLKDSALFKAMQERLYKVEALQQATDARAERYFERMVRAETKLEASENRQSYMLTQLDILQKENVRLVEDRARVAARAALVDEHEATIVSLRRRVTLLEGVLRDRGVPIPQETS